MDSSGAPICERIDPDMYLRSGLRGCVLPSSTTVSVLSRMLKTIDAGAATSANELVSACRLCVFERWQFAAVRNDLNRVIPPSQHLSPQTSVVFEYMLSTTTPTTINAMPPSAAALSL